MYVFFFYLIQFNYAFLLALIFFYPFYIHKKKIIIIHTLHKHTYTHNNNNVNVKEKLLFFSKRSKNFHFTIIHIQINFLLDNINWYMCVYM